MSAAAVFPARARLQDARKKSAAAARGVLQFVPQGSQAIGRGSGITTDPPAGDVVNGKNVEVIPPQPPLAPDDDQLGPLQDVEVLHDGASVELLERCTQFAGCPWSIAEEVQDTPPAPVAERLEDRIELRLS